ncbi:MAG: ATP-binding cassette domain-containing protein, partial [Alphaproteobacteria bacterium]
MAEEKKRSTGYHGGTVDTVISVEAVTEEAARLAQTVTREDVLALANDDPYLVLEDLHAGYGRMEILHGIDLAVARRQSLCLIGPNGAGKSTILHAIFGLNTIFSGRVLVGDGPDKRDIGRLSASEKLRRAGIAYILQDKSVFPGMTVEENLWMGGFLK